MHTRLADPLPLRRGRPLPNRLALAPLTNTQSHPDGTLSDTELAWLLPRAAGGFGLTMTAAAYVHRAGLAWAGQLGVASDDHLPGLERFARGVREAGSVSSVQLHHGGLRADAAASGEPLVGPWDDRSTGARALATREIAGVIDDFAAAAARVEAAGVDGVELHGAHGYLLAAFLAPRNQRTDGYGGDLAGRARLLHEVIDAVLARTGPDFQVGLRLSPERFGLRLDEMVEVTAGVLARGDLDYVDVSLWDYRRRPEGVEEGPTLADRFVGLPRHGTALAFSGRIAGAADAQRVLDLGADLAFVGKGAIVDHAFARHALADAGYEAPPFPVTREHLRSQGVGEPFVNYFASNWPHLVSD